MGRGSLEIRWAAAAALLDSLFGAGTEGTENPFNTCMLYLSFAPPAPLPSPPEVGSLLARERLLGRPPGELRVGDAGARAAYSAAVRRGDGARGCEGATYQRRSKRSSRSQRRGTRANRSGSLRYIHKTTTPYIAPPPPLSPM